MTQLNLKGLDAFGPAIKRSFAKGMVPEQYYQGNVALDLFPHVRIVGEPHVWAVETDYSPARSSAYEDAEGNAGAPEVNRFEAKLATNYAFAKVTGPESEAANDNAGSFLPTIQTRIKSAKDSVARSNNWQCYGNVDGNIGQLASVPANGLVGAAFFTLKEKEGFISRFSKGIKLVVFNDLSGGTARLNKTAGVSEFTVTKIDRGTGVITIAEEIESGKTLDADDYIFVKGDRGGTIAGLEAINPVSAVTAATSLHGLDRSSDITRLSGHRKVAGNASPEQEINSFLADVHAEGGAFSHCIGHSTTIMNIINSVDSKYIGDLKDDDLKYGKTGIMWRSPGMGMIKFYADQDLPGSLLRFFMKGSIELIHYGPALIRILDLDGNMWRAVSLEDAYGLRVGSYFQMKSENPNNTGVLVI